MEIESKKGRGKKREEKHEKGRFKSARFVAEKWPPLKKVFPVWGRFKVVGRQGEKEISPFVFRETFRAGMGMGKGVNLGAREQGQRNRGLVETRRSVNSLLFFIF